MDLIEGFDELGSRGVVFVEEENVHVVGGEVSQSICYHLGVELMKGVGMVQQILSRETLHV